MGKRYAAIPLAAAGLIAGCRDSGPERTHEGHAIEVDMYDNFFEVAEQEALGSKDARNAGKITLAVENRGGVPHNIEIVDGPLPSGIHDHHDGHNNHSIEQGGEMEMPGLTLEPGQAGEITFEPKEIVLSAVCHVPGHRGMEFELDLDTGEITTPQQG